jgi:riboflavin synthase
MFSWIVEHNAKIISVDSWRFVVENKFAENLNIWQSIAHDGACMTLESFNDESYTFFVMQESMNKTNLWSKLVGDYFNVERCIKVWDRIDGHYVSGHIDCVWSLDDISKIEDGSYVLKIIFPEKFSKFLIEKGSICINGVSLTVVECWEWYLTVSIIPHTWQLTNLGTLRENDTVNLEFDMLGKYILNLWSKTS